MRPTTSLAGAHAAVVGDLLMMSPAAPRLRPGQRWIKHLADVAGALFLILITAPLMILTAIVVGLTSTGPVILVETRVGECGREFSRFRFRTAIAGAEPEPGAATEEDPRMTRVGRILRATRLDELPQLFNVLLGDMSLVGPRAERPHFVRLCRDRFPAYELRFAVKPGITGLAQIDCRYSAAPELKLHFDLKYIYHYSPVMDIRILLRTILAVLQPSHIERFKEQPACPPAGSGD